MPYLYVFADSNVMYMQNMESLVFSVVIHA